MDSTSQHGLNRFNKHKNTHRHAFFIPFFALILISFNSIQFVEVSVNYFSYKFQQINQHQQHKYIYLNAKDKQTMDKSSWKTHLYTSSGNATVQCLENKSHFIFGVVLWIFLYFHLVFCFSSRRFSEYNKISMCNV